MDASVTGSIVFADDDGDDDDLSNFSMQSHDDVSKQDVRRGILRNPTNNHQNLYSDKPTAHHPISSPARSRRIVPDPAIHHGRAGIVWPDCETVKLQYYHQNPVLQTRDISDLGQTGSESSRVESWETHEIGSNAGVKKKHTVRFSPEADEACTCSGQGMRTPSDEFKGQVQCHVKQVQGHPERRRLNVGRIAENKFNDGRNLGCVSDTSSSTTKTESSKAGRKWFHFSFRSNKNREKPAVTVESQPTTVLQPMYAESTSVDEEVRTRCRGRREMRETPSYEVNDADNAYVRTLAAQGYRLLTSSVSEPEQLGGYGRWGRSSSSSTHDLRRSPTVGRDGRKSRGAAVRRSRSTVGDDRRRQTTSSPTPEFTVLPARRSSMDLAEYTPPATTIEREAFPAPTSNDQHSRPAWYYGFDGALNRQLPATTHDVAYYARQSEPRNLSTSAESKHDITDKSDAGYRTVTTTGGEVVWSGRSWTTPRQLRTATTPVEAERNGTVMTSNGETAHREMNSILSSDVASNYIVRRESFLPVTGLHSENWTLERHWNIGRLPEIRVIPATDERRRRRVSEKQLSPVTTTVIQSRPRDYNAIYAWSTDLPTTTAMKRSATFGDNWNALRSNADGYMEPTRQRAVPMVFPADRPLWSSLTDDQRHDGPRLFSRVNCSSCGDFVDMRGVCRAVVSAADLLQMELFYRSNKTEVISCACAARLYFASVRRHSSILGSGAAPTQPEVTADAVRWYPTTAVGVPVIVLDCGGSRCRDRKLSLVLAEVGSGFALWRDAVDHLTCYRTVSSDFHCLRFSHDHSRLAGLRFAYSDAAETFSRQLNAVTSGPAGNALLNLSADRRAAKLPDTDFRSSYYALHESTSDTKSGTKPLNYRPELKKCDISGPCCFEHITKFEPVPGFLV